MPDKRTVVIIDDEALARKRLRKLLTPYSDKIEIIGEASNGKEGLEIIQKHDPDFAFLDIQMPMMNGFEMLQNLPQSPYIIFTTAYDEYSLQAFEENSIDYLLKPIREERLQKTIQKMEGLQPSNQLKQENDDQLSSILEHLNTPKKINSLTITAGDRIIILKLTDVVYFLAEDKLTTVVTKQKKEYFISHSLSQLSAKLPTDFIRINRSCIINETEVSDIRKGFNGKLSFTMNDSQNTKFSSGSSYTAAIKERWKF